VFEANIPYDARFFDSLDRMVQYEPWLMRDKAMIDPRRTIGIEKGKPFRPDETTRRISNRAANDAHTWLDLKYESMFSPYYDGHRSNPDSYPVDERGVVYAMAFFSPKHAGVGSFYLMAINDTQGRPFDGGSTHHLHVPANARVKQYWSATVYDRATHGLIRNLPTSSRSSQTPGLEQNADGSVDIYFGAKAPLKKEMNWVPTKRGGQFEVLFRFYGPEKALFDKTWVLPDIELMQ